MITCDIDVSTYRGEPGPLGIRWLPAELVSEFDIINDGRKPLSDEVLTMDTCLGVICDRCFGWKTLSDEVVGTNTCLGVTCELE